ncbi:DUF4097 family beta strand repeat-containing protein [Solicola gregarius]|uniref:DUF4097 domain-containing protein n=1 Tax=Solicola gregarius TaxID=2908642 RepID=A0AA46YN40_9ACTN|nr:DUF4097 family beta strand repeat-containing protein [Solicola gregarius]UYM07091.1 DUF4097 domain-containing protein [Solicola gregarius]
MHTFDTPSPVQLRVSNRAGRVSIEAADVTESTVELTALSPEADEAIAEAIVEQRGSHIVVDLPRGRPGLFRSRSPKVAIDITVPTGSNLRASLQSSDLRTTGALNDAHVEVGSGDIVMDTTTGSARLQNGSGDVQIEQCHGDIVVTLGSGDVRVGTVRGKAQTRSGSGDVTIEHAKGVVTAASGSGDIAVSSSDSGLTAKTGSGDVRVHRARSGEVRVTTASGDVDVSVDHGTAVWLDLNTLSGAVRNELDAIDGPDETEQQLKLRVKTASGDISVARS